MDQSLLAAMCLTSTNVVKSSTTMPFHASSTVSSAAKFAEPVTAWSLSVYSATTVPCELEHAHAAVDLSFGLDWVKDHVYECASEAVKRRQGLREL